MTMFLKLGIGSLVLMLGVVGTVGVAVQQAGIVYVRVEDKTDGVTLRIPVPLALADIALSFIPPDELREARRELRELEPLIKAVFQNLDDLEDATFVEVHSSTERVLVYKDGDDLIVDVESPDERVYVEIPIQGLERICSSVAGW